MNSFCVCGGLDWSTNTTNKNTLFGITQHDLSHVKRIHNAREHVKNPCIISADASPKGGGGSTFHPLKNFSYIPTIMLSYEIKEKYFEALARVFVKTWDIFPNI